MKVLISGVGNGDHVIFSPIGILFNKLGWENSLLTAIIDSLRMHPKCIFAYTILFIAMFLASTVVHWEIIEQIFSIQAGWLFRILYFALLISFFEKKIEFVVKDNTVFWAENVRKAINVEPINNFHWRVSVAWTSTLVCAFIALYFFVGNYSQKFKHECQYVYNESATNVYHYIDDCEEIQGDIEEMQAYEAEDQGKVLCESCKELEEEMKDEIDMHIRP